MTALSFVVANVNDAALLRASFFSTSRTSALSMVSAVNAFASDLAEPFTFFAGGWSGVIAVLLSLVGIFVVLEASFFSAAAGRVFLAVEAAIGDVFHSNRLHYAKEAICLLAFFLAVLSANLIGMVPYVIAATSTIVAPALLSLTLFVVCIIVMVGGFGYTFFAGFLPAGTAASIAPLITGIETVSYGAKFFSLFVRLFANIFAGHLLLKTLYIGLTEVCACVQLAFVPLCAGSFAFVLGIFSLEFMIGLLQAVVFTVLSALYFKEANAFVLSH